MLEQVSTDAKPFRDEILSIISDLVSSLRDEFTEIKKEISNLRTQGIPAYEPIIKYDDIKLKESTIDAIQENMEEKELQEESDYIDNLIENEKEYTSGLSGLRVYHKLVDLAREAKKIQEIQKMKRNRVTRVFIPGKKEFRLLMNACKQSDEMIVNKFLLLMMGMLGLRIGEIIHMKKTWVDFEREMITIPPHEPCDCNYCIKCMKRKVKCKNITPQEVMKECWKPKTEAGARSIPFGFDPEVREVLEKFMTKYKKCPLSVRQIQHRIRQLGELAGLSPMTSHALRAYAITKFAYDGVNTVTLQTVMGWNDLSTADTHIRR
ncbi:unnamed protein product, partial [marine sediment metagenome]